LPNKRRQYRLGPGAASILSVSVRASAKRWLKGIVEDVSACGLRVFFKAGAAPRFSLKEAIRLELASPYLKEPRTVPSLVTFRGNSRDGALYGFEIIDWLGLLSSLPGELKAVFNQRRDYRVRPDPRQPVTVTVGAPGCRVKVQAEDVSASGLSFTASLKLERNLSDQETVVLSLRLPTDTKDLHFRAKVLHSAIVAGGARYGVCLLDEPGEDFERHTRALESYVNRRRRQEILGIP
jgi:hypothetical protein